MNNRTCIKKKERLNCLEGEEEEEEKTVRYKVDWVAMRVLLHVEFMLQFEYNLYRREMCPEGIRNFIHRLCLYIQTKRG